MISLMADEIEQMMNDFSALVEAIPPSSKGGAKKGKNSRSTVSGHGIEFDSKEELDFYEWLLEAQEFGFVDGFDDQPETFTLFEGMRNAKGTLLVRPHVYSPDFLIRFTPKWSEFSAKHKLKAFAKLFPENGRVYCDVKGGFALHGGSREFSINQKWMLAKYSIFVHKVEIPKFFTTTWLPEALILTRKTRKLSKRYGGIATFDAKYSRIPADPS